jgi:hypothetical protein
MSKVSTREKLNEYVGNQLEEYGKYHVLITIDFDTVKDMGVSILQTKFPQIGPGYGGGGFVDALLSNDLEGTFARADSTNRKYILFYLQLLNGFRPYHI